MVSIGEKPWVKTAETTETFGKFVVEPLEKGYGATLGNALRRVLLSSLSGASITAVKIEGVSHPFSTLSGMQEDVLQLLLNLKELIVSSHSEQPKTITLKAKGKGEVLAKDIEHDAEVEIRNPEHVIAHLDNSGKLEISMIVERGKGYIPAERNKKQTLPAGFLPTDSLFSPVLKVNMATDEIRVGQEINYDRLVLSIWTNGSIKPEDALKESAKILARQIDMFVHLGEKVEVLRSDAERTEEIPKTVLEMNVEDLELTARSLNCLEKAQIKTVAELVSFSEEELMKFKNFGSKSLDEVKEKLAEYKLSLKGEKVE